ncbi:hypothetical protein BCR34DRAFT_582273 [Clohesyomyces aquaticus]|uniref:Peroxisomal biogenesis factor 11 n=1 Tax=Clohesyomyces aquaticus TaxID=1231657 RepID=A0A1Y2AAM5_9PLEO|nr:hypothetical protein BCR34DRAFT_582273 [Clohesyomyces aquaticus]
MSSPPSPSPPPLQPVDAQKTEESPSYTTMPSTASEPQQEKPPPNTTIPSAAPEAQREEPPSNTITPPPEPELSPGATAAPSPLSPSPSPSPSPHSPPRNPSPALLSRLRAILHLLKSRTHLLAHRLDTLLLRLSHLLSNPASTDALLSTISYTLSLLSSLLRKTLTRRLSTIPTKSSAILLSGETSTLLAEISIQTPTPTPPSTKALVSIGESAKALAATMDDYRIFVRLWGLVGIYTWARGTYLSPSLRAASPQTHMTDKLLKAITWTQIASCTLFQLLENLAYLSSKSILNLCSKTGESLDARYWIWSSRFWAIHVGLEFLRLYIISSSSSSSSSPDDNEKERKIQREKDSWAWTRDLVTNLAYFPLTIHWGRERGLLSETGVAVLGVVAGGTLVVDAWRGAR